MGCGYRGDAGSQGDYRCSAIPKLDIAKLYDMLPADAGETSEGRTPVTNATVRTVFIVGPDKKIKLMLSYPMSTGRNFDEILRALDSIQLTTKHKVMPCSLEARRGCGDRGRHIGREAKGLRPEGWRC